MNLFTLPVAMSVDSTVVSYAHTYLRLCRVFSTPCLWHPFLLLYLGPLSLNLRSSSAQSPPPISIQSASGEILRLKRVRRLSSTDANETNDDIRSEKVAAVTVADLHAYYAAANSPTGVGGSGGGGGGTLVATSTAQLAPGATITLPAAGSWTQADLDQATAIGGACVFHV